MSEVFGDAPPEMIRAIIYCGRGLKSKKSSVISAKVVFGVESDKRKTAVVSDSNPVWNEEGEFKVSKSEKSVFKFKLYDGDEVIGVIKVPVNEISDEKQIKSLPLEPYKKGQAPPSGELQIALHVLTYKSTTKRRSSTLGHKIKSKLSNSNLALSRDDNTSVVSGDSKASSRSKMNTMKKKIFNKKSKEKGMNGAQSMFDLSVEPNNANDHEQSYNLNPFLNDTDNDLNDTVIKRPPDSKFQTLPLHGSRNGSIIDAAEHVSITGSEQSSIPGSAASLERNKKKAHGVTGGKSLMSALKKPFGTTSRKDRSKSMWDISNLPVENWEQKMEHRLPKTPDPPDNVDDQGIYLDNGSETSNVSHQPSTKLVNSSSTMADSAVDIRVSNATPHRKPHLSIDSGADLESGKFSEPVSRTHSRNNSTTIANTSYNSLPSIVITDLLPNKGSNNGGTKINIIGSNFGVTKEDFKSVKVCGCDVTRSLMSINNSKFTVTTSMWTSGAGFVEIEMVDGRKAISKQTFEFVSASQLTEEAKNIKVPSFNSSEKDQNRSKGSVSNLANARRKFSASTTGLNSLNFEDSLAVVPSPRKKAPDTPSPGKLTPKEQEVKTPSSEKSDKVAAGAYDTNTAGPRTSLNRNTSDRYDPATYGFHSKKELEEEIVKLRSEVRQLTDKNLEMNSYLEELLIKVMSHCPEILQK